MLNDDPRFPMSLVSEFVNSVATDNITLITSGSSVYDGSFLYPPCVNRLSARIAVCPLAAAKIADPTVDTSTVCSLAAARIVDLLDNQRCNLLAVVLPVTSGR